MVGALIFQHDTRDLRLWGQRLARIIHAIFGTCDLDLNLTLDLSLSRWALYTKLRFCFWTMFLRTRIIELSRSSRPTLIGGFIVWQTTGYFYGLFRTAQIRRGAKGKGSKEGVSSSPGQGDRGGFYPRENFQFWDAIWCNLVHLGDQLTVFQFKLNWLT